MQELLKAIGVPFADDEYTPYTMEDVHLYLGVPPITHKGVHQIRAFRAQQKSKLFNCLTGGGAFVSNRNQNGVLSVTVATESPMHAHLQLQDISGAAFPIYCLDGGTNGSSFIASIAARVVLTPEWLKSTRSDFTVYTIACKRMIISGGIRTKI